MQLLDRSAAEPDTNKNGIVESKWLC